MRLLAVFVTLAILASSCEDPVPLQPSPEPPIDSPTAVIAALSRAYQQQNPELVQSLLANDGDANANYLFLLSEPTDRGETQWGYIDEVMIHWNMFQPGRPGPQAVRPGLWVQSIMISLTRLEEFYERKDLYSENAGADGKLDPERWRAVAARYTTDVYFDLAGNDYKVEGEANFVVIDDLAKQVGDAGKFLLYIWEDVPPFSLDAGISSSEYVSWGMIKTMYR